MHRQRGQGSHIYSASTVDWEPGILLTLFLIFVTISSNLQIKNSESLTLWISLSQSARVQNQDSSRGLPLSPNRFHILSLQHYMPITDLEGVEERMMMPKDACILILPSVNLPPDMAGNAAGVVRWRMGRKLWRVSCHRVVLWGRGEVTVKGAVTDGLALKLEGTWVEEDWKGRQSLLWTSRGNMAHSEPLPTSGLQTRVAGWSWRCFQVWDSNEWAGQ